MAVRSLGYVRIATRDLGVWRKFGEEVLGLSAVESSDPNLLLLRMDDRPWRFRIEKSEQERFIAMGLECPNQQSFAAIAQRLRGAGVEVAVGAADLATARHVRELATFNDPSGNQIELFWGHMVAGTPFVSPVGTSKFVTEDGGLGHVVLPALKLKETRAFYVDMLGFADSDEMRIPIDGGNTLGLHFLHATGPRHHVVALGEFPNPTGLIHVMIEAPALDDVGLALDRALKAGAHISSTLGRHTNDRMVSFYVRTPSGFDVEYGCGGYQPDWSTFTPTITQKEDLWGHKWDFDQ